MYKKSLKVTPAEIFIFVMQLLYVASSSEISEYDFYELVIILGYAVAGFMAAIACTTKKVDLLNIVKFSVIIVLMGITAISSAGREFVLLVLYLIILKNATQDRIVNAFYWADIIALTLNIALSIAGVYRIYSVDTNHVTLGFTNSNFLGVIIFDIVVLMIVRNTRNNLLPYVIALLAGLFCWEYPYCRSATLSIIIMLILAGMRRVFEGKKLFAFGLKYSYMMLAIISIYLGKIGPINSLLAVLDEVLSGRIIAWNVYFNNKPITLWGAIFYASDFYALDNSFLYILFRYGVIVFVIYGALHYLVAKKAIESKSYNMQIAFLALLCYAMMEFSPMSVFNNIGLALLTTKNVNKKERELE